MKAYNTPKDELLIKSDEGEELVKITPEKTTIANLEGGGGNSENTIVMYADANAVEAVISGSSQSFTLYGDIGLSGGYGTVEEIPADGYFVCKVVMNGEVITTMYPIIRGTTPNVGYILSNQNQVVCVYGNLLQPQH